jgi:hypothetical protein
MKKKNILLLAILVVLSTMVLMTSCDIFDRPDEPEQIEQEAASKGLEFALNVEGDAYVLSHIGNCTDTNIVIPQKHMGKPVVAIADNCFAFRDKIESVVIPEGIVSIGDRAFSNCYALKSVSLPEGLESIGDSAFYQCSSIEEIDLPESLKELDGWAFANCFNLKEISLPNGLEKLGSGVFSKCKSIESIVIPDTVTELGYRSFEECESLKSIVLGNGIKSLPSSGTGSTVDYGMFRACVSLRSIDIPYGVKVISNGTFYGCKSLMNVTIPSSVTTIEASAFAVCHSLFSITIPESVTAIKNNAFLECESLIEVCNQSTLDITKGSKSNGGVALYAKNVINAPSQTKLKTANDFTFYDDTNELIIVKYIGTNSNVSLPTYDGGRKYAIVSRLFPADNNITDLILTDNLSSVGEHAFDYTDCLDTVTFNCGNINIPEDAFPFQSTVKKIFINSDLSFRFGCFEKLEEAVYGEGVTVIGKEAFMNSPLFKVTLSSTIKEMGENAFIGCSSLKEVIIPNDIALAEIKDRAFMNCISLKSIDLPDSIVSIGESAFERNALTSIDFGKSLVTIGKRAFDNCTVLEKITISDSVEVIGEGAFWGCAKLSVVDISENSSLTTIGREAFSRCEKITYIHLPKNLSTIGYLAFSDCDSLYRIILDSENPTFNLNDGNIYSEDGTIFVLYAPGKKTTSIKINKDVKRIESGAFYGCMNLTSVIFEEGSQLESIGEGAFYGVMFTSISIPSTVKVIEADAISYCQALKTVTFGENSQLEIIGDRAFKDAYVLTNFTMPKSVVYIGESAFAWARIANLHYEGTVEEWNAIEKGERWNNCMGDYMYNCTIHCSDGTVDKNE